MNRKLTIWVHSEDTVSLQAEGHVRLNPFTVTGPSYGRGHTVAARWAHALADAHRKVTGCSAEILFMA